MWRDWQLVLCWTALVAAATTLLSFNKKNGSAILGAADYLVGDLVELDYVPVLKNESSTDT